MATTERVVDFDAFRAEQRSEPITVKVGGEDYTLPADMPAQVALEVVALRKEYGDNGAVPAEKITDIAIALFGREMLDELTIKHRLGASELAQLIVFVFQEYDRAMVPNPTARTNRATRRKRRPASSR